MTTRKPARAKKREYVVGYCGPLDGIVYGHSQGRWLNAPTYYAQTMSLVTAKRFIKRLWPDGYGTVYRLTPVRTRTPKRKASK